MSNNLREPAAYMMSVVDERVSEPFWYVAVQPDPNEDIWIGNCPGEWLSREQRAVALQDTGDSVLHRLQVMVKLSECENVTIHYDKPVVAYSVTHLLKNIPVSMYGHEFVQDQGGSWDFTVDWRKPQSVNSTEDIARELVRQYIATGNSLQVGEFAKNAFCIWAIWSGVIPGEMPFSSARWITAQSWYLVGKVQEQFYNDLKAEGLWQAGYDAMTEEQIQARLLAILEKQPSIKW